MTDATADEHVASILVVDDNAANRLAIAAALAPLGQRVVEAASGAEALRLLLEQRVELILLDVVMPGLDGFETARLIRESPRHGQVPIVFLTAHRADQNVERGYAVGAVDYLEKPVEAEDLRNKVRILLRLFGDLGAAPEPRATVLVVDDKPQNLVAFEGALALLGEDVVTAASGEEALGLLCRHEFAVVLLDVLLPGKDGFETAAAIRANPRTRETPVILVSAVVRAAEDVRRGYAVGAADFLFAPVTPAVLRAKVRVFVELYKKRERLRYHEEETRRSQQAELERRAADERLRLSEQNQRMREQLMLADRLASMGTVAAGVGHEINGPLAVVVANLELVEGELGRLGSEAATHLGGPDRAAAAAWLADGLGALAGPVADARAAAERVRLIVLDLKGLSRSDDENRGPVDVHQVLESSVRMCWNELRHRARVVKELEPVRPVLGNAARLSQALLILVSNAAQAIRGGAADANVVRLTTRMDGADRVVIEVHDTGCGIAPENLARIFDPFFTTKPIGSGTGLGLAICHRIVTSLGGEISVESQLGVGSTFRVTLPAAATPPEERAAPTEPPGPAVAAGRRGRVLVVDDEAPIRKVLARLLRAEHDVLETESGRTALAWLEGGERFDAILCDLMMPDLTGMDLHAALARSHPEQTERMLFMTGGVFTAEAREFLGRWSKPTLSKPFDAKQVRALVNDLVNRERRDD